MNELLNQIKKNRLPKEVLILCDALNDVNTKKNVYTIYSPLGDYLFDVSGGEIKPYYYNIHNFIFYKQRYSTDSFILSKKHAREAIENSRYSNYTIL